MTTFQRARLSRVPRSGAEAPRSDRGLCWLLIRNQRSSRAGRKKPSAIKGRCQSRREINDDDKTKSRGDIYEEWMHRSGELSERELRFLAGLPSACSKAQRAHVCTKRRRAKAHGRTRRPERPIVHLLHTWQCLSMGESKACVPGLS